MTHLVSMAQMMMQAESSSKLEQMHYFVTKQLLSEFPNAVQIHDSISIPNNEAPAFNARKLALEEGWKFANG